MAWRRPGDKPLSEPMMVRLPTHAGFSRPQWVNYLTTQQRGSCPGDAGYSAAELRRLLFQPNGFLCGWCLRLIPVTDLGLGLGLQVLYSVTNCTGNILGCFTNITSNRTRLQCTNNTHLNTITKKQRYGKIILYKESDNIESVMSIWRDVFSWLIIYINSKRELSAMVLNLNDCENGGKRCQGICSDKVSPILIIILIVFHLR